MCGSLSLRPAKSQAGMLRRIAATIQSFILLQEALAVLPPLAQALEGARCELLRAVGAACGHVAFDELQREVDAVLEEDVRSAKNSFLNRHAGRGGLCAVRSQAEFSMWRVACGPNKRTLATRRTQQCFAVRSGVDGFLDVARQTFCRVTEQAGLGWGMRALWKSWPRGPGG
jgi:DNA mismatch repair protein MSH4